MLYLSHYPVMAGHPGARRMYGTMRTKMYWPHMANHAYATVKDCRSCTSTRGTRYNHQKHLKWFPASGPLEFVAMDVLGPLPRTDSGKQFVVVMTDLYSNMTRAVPTSKITASHIAFIFLDSCIYPNGIPSYVLNDNGPQFVGELFSALCGYLGYKKLETTAYHPQSNGQTERYNKNIAAGMRHYVSEHQTDWDTYIQPLTYA